MQMCIKALKYTYLLILWRYINDTRRLQEPVTRLLKLLLIGCILAFKMWTTMSFYLIFLQNKKEIRKRTRYLRHTCQSSALVPAPAADWSHFVSSQANSTNVWGFANDVIIGQGIPCWASHTVQLSTSQESRNNIKKNLTYVFFYLANHFI